MARSGLKTTGSVYGYERSDDKSLKVVVSESVVVSKIFKLYSEHKSLGKVAESLSRQKVETRRGKLFSRMTIKNILNNNNFWLWIVIKICCGNDSVSTHFFAN